ncbi:amino acid ABC transporter substrate-binding protein [Streptomyces sp. SCUT-3]|uniref:ABC transporter substrate-binding protein n=1 Tax=Streptomyces TaxID=1883 RepID=UPI0015FB7778|nr:ABC transporter substrate-binding protein [Streptomyces sp. SCUT-3]QMV22706.1 amino acid ABC transporter substrate-binding protein [Streptomyces sp. SCUT-3]
MPLHSPTLSPASPASPASRTRARTRRRARGTAVVAAALAVLLTGCGGSSLESEGGGEGGGAGGGTAEPLVVGSAGFTESVVMAHLYAQLLEDAGRPTEVKTVENRELYEPALEKGEIDVVPEYAATLAEFLNAKENGADAPPVASPDVDDTVEALRGLAGPRGLKVLDPGAAVDQNAFAVTEGFAKKHGLKTLSDVGEKKLRIRLAAGDECPDRPFCEPGLEKTYGIDVVAVDPKGVGTPQAKQAVKDGTDQMVLTTTTDATLEQFGLVLLEDDRNLQNADNVLPVVNADSAGSEEVAKALGRLTEVLTTEDLTGLNRQVDAERRKPADVAASYLESKGLLKG